METIWCLCFSEEKGFYKKNEYQTSADERVILRSHTEKGFKTIKAVIPEMYIEIVVKTNFGYASASYMYAFVTKDGKPLLDFDADKLYTLNFAKLEYLCVKQGDWIALFNKIIKVLNSEGHFTQEAVEYIESLSVLSSVKSIKVKRNMHCPYTTWNSEFLVLLHFGNKLKNLIENLKDQGDVCNNLLSSCRLLLNKLNKMLKEIDMNSSRFPQIVNATYVVYEFMCSKGIRHDFLKIS